MKHYHRPIAVLLALALLLGLLPASLTAAAESIPDEPASAETVSSKAVEQTEEIPAANGMNVHTPYGLRLGSGETETRSETKDLPAYYNSADLGLVTSVKNQTQYGQYGTCWAFGTLSPIETYMIKNGLEVGDSGLAATTDLDLSEYHLSYFTYSNSHDEHGLTDGDSSILQGESHLNVGGDGYKATLTLMRWIGPASEEEADLAYSEASPSGTIDPKYAYAYDVGRVTSVDWIEPTDTALIKQYLQEYGSAFIGYYYNPSYQGSGGAYCYISTSASNDYGPNHGVTLVGWNDNYSKSNFTGLSKPTNNGAWIVKNSWGDSSYTDHGYTYISYEDTSYLGHPIMFFTVEPLDAYDHLYQYDGTCFTGNAAKGWIPLTQNRSLVSNVFTAAGHETVEAFSICTLEEGLKYTLDVYKNPTKLTGSNPDPTSDDLMSTQTGTIAHSGYHTIPIASPFKVEAGDKFSAVFTLESQQSAANFQMVIPVDETETEDYTENGSYLATLVHTHVSHPGTSFFRLRDNATWSQLDNGASLRIKAYTTDAPFDLTVEAGPHGTAVLGDYTAQGYKVTASPDSGYYTSGYSITSGNAAVIQNGNIFYVDPTEATTIHINFAQQEPFTLSYSANGQPYGSAVTGVTGDAVTLPAAASAFEGYTFLGWTTSSVPAAVTGKPLYLEPGAAYYPLGGNTTLYALYSFQQLAVPGQDGSYVKISSSVEFTDGSYLIVNEEASRALDGSKASSSGMWAPINTAPNYVDVTISNDRIPDSASLRASDFTYDPGTRQFYSASGYPVGGYKNSYFFYVWGAGSTSAAQTVSFDASGNAVIRDDYYGNTLNYNAAATAYFAYQTAAAKPVQLYRKTEDTTTTYYSTLVNAAPAVTWTVSFESNGGTAVPAQTVVDGQTVSVPAPPTRTGFTFAGWYADPGLTQAYNFADPVTASFTLYAKWEEEGPVTTTYTVTFLSNGGTAVPSQTVTSGETASRPADPTRTGCAFDGWYTDAALTQAYAFSTPVTGNITLYAAWNVTLTYKTNGAVTGTEIVRADAAMTLPAAATAFDGWSFLGWTAVSTEETETAPAYTAAGGSFTPAANTTLHALYTRGEAGGGEQTYELVASAPGDWTGSYVISYGTTASMYLMKGVTPSSNGASIENDPNAVSCANTGAVLTGTTLSNVAADYVFDFAAQDGYYSVKNRGSNTWLGVTSSSYLAAYTAYDAAYCRWTPGTGTNASSLKNASNGTYPYVSYTSSGKKFWTSSSVNTSVRLWKGSQAGTTWYTTVIGEAGHVHTVAYFAGQAATCTGEGVRAYYYCADASCELYGRMYEDEELTVEITDAVLPALGHDFTVLVEEVAPTCTETGLLEYKCSRCDETDLTETAALGHLAGAPVQENYVAPTTTAEGGYDTVTYCQRCGVELSREHTVLPIIEVTEPIETEALHIYNSISVGTDMVITFTARKNDLTDYNNFWIEVVKHNPDGDVSYTYDPDVMTEGSSTWSVQFKHIYAKEMGVEVEARLYAENDAGQVFMSPVRSANIRDYLGGRLTATNNKVQQRVLAADMLNYGAAAQRFTGFQTDHLVNEELTSDQLAKLHQYETSAPAPVNKTNYNTRPAGQPNILFTSVTLGNEVLLNLTIRLTEGTEGVQVLVKNHATGDIVTTLDTTFLGSTFNAVFNGIGADAMRTEFDLVTVVNGVETGNIRTWSVEAYVGEIRAEGLPLKVAMANALLTYGDSAAAYFAAQ